MSVLKSPGARSERSLSDKSSCLGALGAETSGLANGISCLRFKVLAPNLGLDVLFPCLEVWALLIKIPDGGPILRAHGLDCRS